MTDYGYTSDLKTTENYSWYYIIALMILKHNDIIAFNLCC